MIRPRFPWGPPAWAPYSIYCAVPSYGDAFPPQPGTPFFFFLRPPHPPSPSLHHACRTARVVIAAPGPFTKEGLEKGDGCWAAVSAARLLRCCINILLEVGGLSEPIPLSLPLLIPVC